MTGKSDRSSRRQFVTNVGRVASAAALGACIPSHDADASTSSHDRGHGSPGDWDLSWIKRITAATDRAVFDCSALEDPSDSPTLRHISRFLDNCEEAYAPNTYKSLGILVLRAGGVPAALNDAAWRDYSIGAEYSQNDPSTQKAAVRNPLWHRPSGGPASDPPTLEELVHRGSVILVCNFALGRTAERIAKKIGKNGDDVHRDMHTRLVPGAIAVPSGIFGLARAQNSGCAYIKV